MKRIGMFLPSPSICAFAMGSLVLASGCATAPAPTAVDRDYGRSHRMAIKNQTLNPDAENNLDPVVGMGGDQALGAMNNYYSSFGGSAANGTKGGGKEPQTLGQQVDKTLGDADSKLQDCENRVQEAEVRADLAESDARRAKSDASSAESRALNCH